MGCIRHRLNLTQLLVSQSYLFCQVDMFDEQPVMVHLAGGQLLPRGPALLQHPHLRALGFDEETDAEVSVLHHGI